MSAHSRRALSAGVVALLTFVGTPPARADFVVLANDIELGRIPGTLGVDQSRGLEPVNLDFGDTIQIRGLAVQSTNVGGTRGEIVLTIDSLQFKGSTVLALRISEIYDVDPTFPLVSVSSRFQGLLQFTDPTQQGQIDESITVQDRDLPTQHLAYQFGDTIVSGVRPGGADDTVPLESMSLSFAKMEIEYKEQKGPPDRSQGLNNFQYTLQWQAVPEPTALGLVGVGTLCLLGYRWRRGRAR